MKKLLYITAAVAALSAAPALAATTMTSTPAGNNNNLALPGSTVNITFDQPAGTAFEANSKGLTATFSGAEAARRSDNNGGLQPGSVPSDPVITPNPDDGNGYFAVGASTATDQSSLTLTGQNGALFSTISFFVGTLDSFNTVDLLGATGNVIATFTGFDMFNQNGASPSGVGIPGGDPSINRRVTFTGDLYNGIKFYNTGTGNKSFEFDNVSFTAAVPEPATWAMMMLGFAMVGAAARYRRRSTNVRFA